LPIGLASERFVVVGGKRVVVGDLGEQGICDLGVELQKTSRSQQWQVTPFGRWGTSAV